jgi:flagellar protein FlbD
MIKVTRLDGSIVVVNAGHILLVEQTPDTLLVLTTGYRLVVREPVDEVISRVREFRRSVVAGTTQMALTDLSGALPTETDRSASAPPLESES